jgi:hypothetical protein
VPRWAVAAEIGRGELARLSIGRQGVARARGLAFCERDQRSQMGLLWWVLAVLIWNDLSVWLLALMSVPLSTARARGR